MVTMRDVGGLMPQKQLLQELVLYPLQNSSAKGEQYKVPLSSVMKLFYFPVQGSSFLMEYCSMGHLVLGSLY